MIFIGPTGNFKRAVVVQISTEWAKIQKMRKPRLLNRTSFRILPSNTLTHCMAALLRTVNRLWLKELGKRTGRRSSPMEQPKLIPGKRG